MNAFFNKQCRWLLPTVLILFILEVITFPFVLGFTWAGGNESPERILTYSPGKLTWDREDKINADGTIELSLFDSVYQNVNSDDADKVVAPGTENNSVVRLKNNAKSNVSYTAVLYRIKSNDALPVEVSLSDSDFADIDSYSLPKGINSADVIRAVSGNIGGGKIQDFDIDWNWQFENGNAQDIFDTQLGDKAASENADDITVGFYIVVEDNGNYVSPNTGNDDFSVNGVYGIYIVLLCISAFMLILLIISKRRNKKCEE